MIRFSSVKLSTFCQVLFIIVYILQITKKKSIPISYNVGFKFTKRKILGSNLMAHKQFLFR